MNAHTMSPSYQKLLDMFQLAIQHLNLQQEILMQSSIQLNEATQNKRKAVFEKLNAFKLQETVEIHLSPPKYEAEKQIDARQEIFKNCENFTQQKTGKGIYQCHVCTANFKSANEYRTHVHIRGLYKENIKCSVCNKHFRNTSLLIAHMRGHTGEKPFKCDVCDSAYQTKGGLYKHKLTHMNSKKYQCGICDKTFTQASSLRAHMRCHTGEKPFKCEQCDCAFAQSTTLLLHIRRKHTKEVKFTCTVCSKGYILKSELRTHMRKHTGDRPFLCDICSAAYTSTSHLKRHKLTHENGNHELQEFNFS